jgi:peroxiredoxin
MRIATHRAWAVFVVGVALAPVAASGERVENFALLDETGRFHELYRQRGARAVVLFVQGNGCPIARGAVPVLNALQRDFAPRGVVFLALNANPQDDRADVRAEAGHYGLEVPVLLDETQLVAESLGIERTAEVLVIDPAGWRVLYRGPLDDRLDYETQRPVRRRFAREVLEAQLAGDPVEVVRRDAPGCLIHLPHGDRAAHARISYADDVAPILVRRCLACHQAGGPAPWAMDDFAAVQGWSPMMREVIRTRRMPPWQADPHVGRFRNALTLTPAEERTLVHWIEAGAARGEGPDPLSAGALPAAPEWPLGTPDRVLEAPRQEIPATGVVPYRYVTVAVDLDRDVWIRAADVRPTNPAATHHATAYIVYPDAGAPPDVEGPRWNRGLFAGYVPGREPEPFPDDGGFRLPRGSRIRFQLHYSSTGRPEVDTPRVGLYLSDAPLAHELKIGAAVNLDFEIPPGAPEHEAEAVHRLGRDVVVYRLTPHMHYRGRRMAIEAEHPDGRRELLLSVPRYNFNWQHQYVLAEPLRLARGTRIVARAAFDNSADNPANPDPEVLVTWGEQSFDEMLIGYFLYRDAGPGPTREARAESEGAE